MITFYKPKQGDTASVVADGYATNFETLDTAKADARATAEALAAKVDKAEGEDLMTSAEREKLTGIEAGANAYTHPESHSADMIDDTAEKVMMTSAEREKLTGIEAGANAYTLPVATALTLGGIKAGDNVTIADDGTLSATVAPYELPKATSTVLGGVKVGRNLSIDTDGRLSAVGGGSGEGGGILVLPYVAPERDSDGNITNSAAFVDAWGGILSAYLAAPDSHALYMDTEADEGLMLRMPCNVMNMGGETDAVQWLISGFTVVNAPVSASDPVSCKATCMANVVCNAAGEMQSLVMYASEGIVGADGQPNLLGADDAVIVAIPNDATEEQLKAIMQPVVEALQANPKRRVVIQYGFLLIPVTTAITDTEFLIAALDANPLTVSDPDSKWIVKAQVYCKLSNGVIESATGGVTGYELATTDAMTAALAGKLGFSNYLGDLNDIHTAGLYRLSSGCANTPYGDGLGSLLLCVEWNTDAARQVFYVYNTPDIYTRVKVAGVWREWQKLWHSGNFDPNSLFRRDGYFEASALNDPEMAMIGNKASTVNYGGHGGLLVSFSAPASGSPLQFLVDQYQANTPLRWRHGIDNNRFANPNFRTIWDSGNFDPGEYLKSTYKNVGSVDLLKGGMTFDYNSAGAGISGPLISFGGMGGRYDCQLVGEYVDGNIIKFRVRNGDRETWNGWRELYHTGNLTPATAASVGLMSAEDKIKLNSVASAMSLTVQTADTPATLSLTDEAIPETAVTPGVSVRAQRAAQYQMQADELLYDALEAFARNHPEYSEFAAWLEVKDRIRQQIPMPETVSEQ